MPVINIAKNLKVGATQVLRVMHRLEQVWPPMLLCQTFSDDFERLELGPDWTDGPIFDMGSFTVVRENAIADGAYVAGENDEPAPVAVMGSIRTTAEFPGDQFIEATVGDFFQGHNLCLPEHLQIVEGEMWLFTQVQPDSNACIGVYVIIQVNQGPDNSGGCYMQLITVDADGVRDHLDDGTYTPLFDWRDNPDYLIRFESTEAGHCKAFFQGHLVVEGDVTPVGGPHIGMAQQWNRTSYGSGGAPVEWADDFATTLDPWHLAPAYARYSDYPVAFDIGSGAVSVIEAYDTSWSSTTSGWRSGMMQRDTPADGIYQFVEITISGVWQHAAGTNPNKRTAVYLLTDANPHDGSFAVGTYRTAVFEFQTNGYFHVVGGVGVSDPRMIIAGHVYITDSPVEFFNYWDSGHGGAPPGLDGSPLTLRVDSYRSGLQKYYVNGRLMASYTSTTVIPEGAYQAIKMHWDTQAEYPTNPGTTSSRILSAIGGGACAIGWCDDFQRADGAIGPDWVLGFETGTGETPVLPTISSGAVVWPQYNPSHTVAAAMWAVPAETVDQFIELTFENWIFAIDRFHSVSIELWNFGDPTGGDPANHSPPRRAALWQIGPGPGQGITVSGYSYLADSGTSDGDYVQYYGTDTPYPWPRDGSPQTFRLESYADGRQVVKVNGTVILDYVDTEAPWTGAGRHQGFWASWNYLNPGPTAPRILDVCGGGIGVVTCDYFDRVDGPLGPIYVDPPAQDYRTWDPMSIVDNHVEWTNFWIGGVTRPAAAARVATVVHGPQAIEIVLGRMPDNIWVEVELFCSFGAEAFGGIGAYWQLLRDRYTTGAEGDLIYANGFYNDEYDSTFYWGDYDTVTGESLVPESVTLRLEWDPGTGYARALYNGVVHFEGVADEEPVSYAPYVGFTLTKSSFGPMEPSQQPWLESVCIETVATNDGTSPRFEEVVGGQDCPAPPGPAALDLLFVVDWSTSDDLDFHISGPLVVSGTGGDGGGDPGRFHLTYYNQWVDRTFQDGDMDPSTEYLMMLGTHLDAPPNPGGTYWLDDWPPTIYESPGYVPGGYAVWVDSWGDSYATTGAVARMYSMPEGGQEALTFDDDDHLVVDLSQWTLVDTFSATEATGALTDRLWHVCDIEVTETSYTVTRIMRVEAGDEDTVLLPD